MISLDSVGETLPIVEEAASSITRRSVEGSSSVDVSLPFVLQLKLAQNLIRKLGISEREFKYTPRQLLILELANGYLSSRNFIYIESISTLIGSKEIPGSIPLKPALCLLLKQQRLLDLPIDQINRGVSEEEIGKTIEADFSCLMKLTHQIAALMKLEIETYTRALTAFISTCKGNRERTRTIEAERFRRTHKTAQISPNQVKLHGEDLGSKMLRQMRWLSHKLKNVLPQHLDKILKSCTNEREGQQQLILQSQCDRLLQSRHLVHHQLALMEQNLFVIQQALKMNSEESPEDVMQALSFYEKPYQQTKHLRNLLSTFCPTYAHYLREQAILLAQQNGSLLSLSDTLPEESHHLLSEWTRQANVEVEQLASSTFPTRISASQEGSDAQVFYERITPAISMEKNRADDSLAGDRKLIENADKAKQLGPSPLVKKKPAGRRKPLSQKRTPLISPASRASSSIECRDPSPSSSSSGVSRPFTNEEMKSHYIDCWEAQITRFSQKYISQLQTVYFKEKITLHAGETLQHLRYSFAGFQLLMQAIQKQHWLALGEIIPLLLMDLGIQLEQLMTIQHIGKNRSLILYHDLVFLAEELTLDQYLSPAAKNHLERISLVTLWARYPLESSDYYKRKQMSHPPGLQLILNSLFLLDSPLEQGRAVELIQETIQLFGEHLSTSAELLQLLTGSKEVSLLANSLKSSLQHQLEEHLPSSIQSNLFEIEAEKLLLWEAQLEAVFNPFLSQRGVKLKLQEALFHLKRMRHALHLFGEAQPIGLQAWFMRSSFKIQQVVEQLYQLRQIIRGELPHRIHDLHQYHLILNDPEEMALSLQFDFGKQLHYTQLAKSHPAAAHWMSALHQLESEMKRHQSSGFIFKGSSAASSPFSSLKQPMEEILSSFLSQTLSVLELHLQACQLVCV